MKRAFRSATDPAAQRAQPLAAGAPRLAPIGLSRRIWLPAMVCVVLLGVAFATAQARGSLTAGTGGSLFVWANVALFSVAMSLSCLALNRTHARLLHRDRLYAILSQTNQSIVRSRDRTTLFAQICRIAVGPGAFRGAWIGLWDKSRATLERVAQEGIPMGDDSQTLAERAIHSQTATLAKGGARSAGSQAAFPIVMNGRSVGCLVINSDEPQFFGEEETQLLREVAGDMAFALDLIDREARRALIERDLWESQSRLRLATAAADIGFWDWDIQGNRVHLSPEWTHQIGYTEKELTVEKVEWEQLLHPDDRERVQRNIQEHLAGQTVIYESEFRLQHRDRSYRWIHSRAQAIRDAAGKPIRMVGWHLNVTDRKQAEIRQDLHHAVTAVFADARSLEEAAKKVMGLICGTMEWSVGELWLVDRASACLRSVDTWSVPGPEFATFLERTRKFSFPMGEGIPGQVWSLNRALLITDIASDPRTLRKADAAAAGLNSILGIPVRSRETTTGVMLFLAPSIPELGEEARTLIANLGSQMGQFHQRLRIEEQFLQSQKMEAIGQLAGGVAHDFNNLLTVIKAYPQLILQTPNLAAEAKDWLEQMSLAADRAAGLTRQLLTFSRKQLPQFRPIDLNETVQGLSNMLRRIIGEDISLQIDLTPVTGPIDADIGMLEQVLMNLVVNARDAMPQGGQLTVSTRQVQLDRASSADRPRAREGDFLVLAVIDTGCGISPEVMKHIFEPFFTTKDPGKGTGLGLATIYGIVEQHRGWVELASQENRGTTFKVYLPMSRSPATRPKDTSAPPPTLPVGRETILLVEDEPAVSMLTRVILERLGYTVIDAVSGVAALELWNSQHPAVDLLITDMIMPHGVTGRDLAEKLRAQKPDLKILFTTGYSPSSVARGMNLIEGVNFIQKPYIPQALSSAIRACLEQPPLPL